MKKNLSPVLGLLILALGIGCGIPLHAQSVDYGSLESLFGEPITTGATGTPQRASEVAADMTIITADEIRQSGQRSLPHVLSRVAGLNILQEGANTWDVGVRGYQQPYQPRLLVLIDGRQVFIDDYSRMNWDNLPVNVDDIRQIEVVKGASSALFGSNATGGVVNIITYSPIYDKSNVASISVGTQNALIGDATGTIGLGNFGGVKISAGGLDMDEFSSPRPAGELPGLTRPTHRYITQNSVFQAGEGLQFNTHADFTEKNGQEAHYGYGVLPVKTTSYSAGGGFDWQTSIGLIRNTNYINHYYLGVAGSLPITTGNTLIVSQFEDQFKLGADHTLRAMFEYRHKDFKSNNAPYQFPRLSENSYSVGGTWLWQINDKWSMTNALRVDHNDMEMNGNLVAGSFYPQAAYTQSFDTIAANSGIVYKLTDMDTLRATYGRGVQNPSEIESGWNNVLQIFPGFMLDEEGNPNLNPTIVQNYGLGYDRKIPEIMSVGKVSAYYEVNDNLKAGAPSGTSGFSANGIVGQAINVGTSKGWGGEVEVKGKSPSGFRWDGSYSYQTIRDNNLVAATLNYAKSAPQHHFRGLLGYTTGPWEFDVNGQYVTSTAMLRSVVTNTAAVEVATSGYASFGGRVGYAINDHVTLATSLYNLTTNATTSAYPDVERQALMTLTGRF